LFPVDWNSAIASLLAVWRSHGRIAALVVPKGKLPLWLTPEQAQTLVADGLIRVAGAATAEIQLLAVGAYQLEQALLAAARLSQHQVAASVWALLEPGRFRQPRDRWEADYLRGAAALPTARQRLLFCHTRPEPLLGALRPLDLGAGRCAALGYRNRGGTLDTFGMLVANRCTWAHGVAALAELCGEPARHWLSPAELAAVAGSGDPELLRAMA
jgi:phosphoketolase